MTDSSRDIFCCPACKSTLVADPQAFICASCQRSYPLVGGIPDFSLPGNAQDFSDEPSRTWLDARIATARDTVYSCCTRQLKGMSFCMQKIAGYARAGDRILEAGMGTGHFTTWLAEIAPPGTRIYAFDISWPMLEITRAKTTTLEAVILFRGNTREQLPFKENSFDIVFLRLAPLGPHGVPNVQAGFDLLKPGGWYVEAGWEPARYETPPTDWAIQHGYASSEYHEWLYWRDQSEQEYTAFQIEQERMASQGIAVRARERRERDGGWQVLTCENLLIAQKPAE